MPYDLYQLNDKPIGNYIGDLINYPTLLISVLEGLPTKERKLLCMTNRKINEICKEYFPTWSNIYNKYRTGNLIFNKKEERDFEVFEGPIEIDTVDFRTGERSRFQVDNVEQAKKQMDKFFSKHPEYKGQGLAQFYEAISQGKGYMDFIQESLKYGELLEFKDPPTTNEEQGYEDTIEGLTEILNTMTTTEQMEFFRNKPYHTFRTKWMTAHWH